VIRFPTILLAAAPLLLGGCQTVFDLVGVEQPLTALEARNFNGSYQGSITQTAQAAPGCPLEHGEKVIMVGDGVLWYAYTPSNLFTAAVGYDGTVSATSGAATLAGKIDGNHLAATIQSPSCQTTISMNYIFNHS
jgi:hypothetical protein